MNYVIISSIDWSTHWQMHHQLATSLASNGHRVLFIENTGVRQPRIGDFGRILERARNWLRSVRGFRQIADKITVFSPLFLPFPSSRVIGYINKVILSRSITKWMRCARFSDPVVFTFLPTPLAQSLIREIDPVLVIYYCANDMAGSSPSVSYLRPWEDKLFKDADIVFSISDAIFHRAIVHNEYVYNFPPGVDYEKFEAARIEATVPDDLASVRRPVIGYVGALSGVLDQDLILQLAHRLTDATIVLVGPKYTDVSRLEGVENIMLLGERPHSDIPSYIGAFDVALIPYVKTSFVDSVYPCKLNEYLAMGIPVVSTNISEIRAFQDRHGKVVEIGGSADDLIAKVQESLSGDQREYRHLRIAVANENSWNNRFAGLMAVVAQRLSLPSVAVTSWQDRLTNYYRQNRAIWLGAATKILILYLLFFYTPFVWFVGKPLVVSDVPAQADAIVVFSGDGDTSYANPGYQKRALDAIKYFEAGYAPKIVLSSGREQTIAEVELIRAFLVSRGVPSSAVYIVERYPNSTYENVREVSRVLRDHGFTSVLFITAPYHKLRSMLTWKKVSPDIDVLPVTTVDVPSEYPEWASDIGRIKIVFYEYAAIAVNWIKGRI